MSLNYRSTDTFKCGVDPDILLRELSHRCGNDLQLVVSMLSLQARNASNDETRRSLEEAVDRIAILARARTSLHFGMVQGLEHALSQVCAALQSQCEPGSILISLRIGTMPDLPEMTAITLALVVNELVTNALKHAFEHGANGRVTVEAQMKSDELVITVADDGKPFPPTSDGAFRRTSGFGIDLVASLVSSIDAIVIGPMNDSKAFEVRMPVAVDCSKSRRQLAALQKTVEQLLD